MFKFLREISRTDAFGFPAAYDDERNSSFSGFSDPKSGVTIARRATIRDVNDLSSGKTQVRPYFIVVVDYTFGLGDHH